MNLGERCSVSVCILSRNAAGILHDCLSSIFSSPDVSQLDLEVIVVDNASSDATAETIRRDFPAATLIQNAHNAGFAEGNNQSIRQSRGNIVVLLNNDTIVQPGALTALCAAMEADRSIVIAGGQLLNPDGSTQREYYKIDLPTAGSLVRELFLVDRWWPQNPWHRHSRAAGFDFSQTQYVGQVPGAFMGIQRDFLDATGLLDERFYYWYEDVELCHRASSKGLKVAYVPEARVVHLGGATFDSVLLAEKSKWRYTSLRKYVVLTFAPFPATIVQIAIIISLLVRIPAFFLLAAVTAGGKKWIAAAKASSLILRDVLFSR